MNTLTIHADASFSPITMCAGYGFYIKNTHETITQGGALPAHIKDSNDAELAAIFAGLWTASRRPWFVSTELIFIRSDSVTALMWIEAKTRPLRVRPVALDLHLKIQAILSAHPNINIDIKHVRGHQGGSNNKGVKNRRPGWVNNRVDELAREGRLKAERRR